MKLTVALFTLVVVCCTQTLAQGFGPNGEWIGEIYRHPRFPPLPSPRTILPSTIDFSPVTDIGRVDFQTTPSTIPGGVGGPGGLVPGGLHEVEITQEHMDLATFAATAIGREYTLNNVTRVQMQVVAGINYHMEISITKTKGSVQTSLNCEVKIYHIVWKDEMTLDEFKCIRVTSV